MLRDAGWWCPLAFVCWLFTFVTGVCALILAIVLSAVTKLVLAAIWPAYITAGWLRFFGAGGRRRESGCCSPVVQGLKAGYQVLWAADLLTNACIIGGFDLFSRTLNEFAEIATGDREQLSPECRKIACLPPVIVGLFRGEWDMAEGVIANQLGISKDEVKDAWKSLREQMITIGQQELASGLLTEEYIFDIPPELVIGLPARVLLETAERATESELVLASGLRLKEDHRPSGKFADMVWTNLQEARAARAALQPQLTVELRRLLCGVLLAGGGEPSSLPDSLRVCVESFDRLQPALREKCAAVQRPLVAVAVECSRQRIFRDELASVITALAGEPDNNAAYKLLSGAGGARHRHRGAAEEAQASDVSETGSGSDSESGDGTILSP
jgi:hypothetical protein